MTNDQTGAALAGNSYARMKLLFDATRVTGGTGDVTINSSDTTQTVFTNVAPGALIHSYYAGRLERIHSVSGTGQTIATETVAAGQTYAAALATQTTGGKNVLFSTAGVMADSNLLWQAIDYVAKDPGISVSLEYDPVQRHRRLAHGHGPGAVPRGRVAGHAGGRCPASTTS